MRGSHDNESPLARTITACELRKDSAGIGEPRDRGNCSGFGRTYAHAPTGSYTAKRTSHIAKSISGIGIEFCTDEDCQ